MSLHFVGNDGAQPAFDTFQKAQSHTRKFWVLPVRVGKVFQSGDLQRGLLHLAPVQVRRRIDGFQFFRFHFYLSVTRLIHSTVTQFYQMVICRIGNLKKRPCLYWTKLVF